jgi:HSP20 family protein
VGTRSATRFGQRRALFTGEGEKAMAEVKVVKTESPRYGMVPFPGRDLFRTNPFGMHPLKLMKRLTHDLDRTFGDFGFGGAEEAAWRPAIEVKRDKDKLLVHAELPGMKKEDVKVTVTGDLLEIEGERKLETEEKKAGVVHSERNYGRFYRAVPMPDGADAGKAVAEFANGMLEITIPVPEVVPAVKEIPIGEAKASAEVTH